MAAEKNVTVLLSGRGSNLKALIQQQSGFLINHVISDRADAGGLAIAQDAGIATSVVPREAFKSLADFKRGVLDRVRLGQPDLVALAGFMVLLQPEFVESYHGRLINIHPSLLPDLPGLDTHRRALTDGAREHGCTVHFVDSGMDTGPLIAQARVSIVADDTPDTLAARVLVKEHSIYPWVLRKVAQGEIHLNGREVEYSSAAFREAREMKFDIFSNGTKL